MCFLPDLVILTGMCVTRARFIPDEACFLFPGAKKLLIIEMDTSIVTSIIAETDSE